MESGAAVLTAQLGWGSTGLRSWWCRSGRTRPAGSWRSPRRGRWTSPRRCRWSFPGWSSSLRVGEPPSCRRLLCSHPPPPTRRPNRSVQEPSPEVRKVSFYLHKQEKNNGSVGVWRRRTGTFPETRRVSLTPPLCWQKVNPSRKFTSPTDDVSREAWHLRVQLQGLMRKIHKSCDRFCFELQTPFKCSAL